MKKTLIVILLLSLSLLSDEIDSEANIADLYFSNPSVETFKVASEHYQKLIETDATDVDSRLMLSYLYLYEMDRIVLPLSEQTDSLEPRQMFQYANLLLSLGSFDESIEIYDKLNEKAPKWSCPWRHKGEAYFKSNQLEKAEEALKMSIETRIEHYDAYVMLADVQKNMGKNKVALETLETGFSYYGKDIEDPEKEVVDSDVKFLHLELLKLNNKTEDYEELRKKLFDTYPDDKRWVDFQ